MRSLLFLILYLCLVVSCHDSKKDKLFDLNKDWSGKEIKFPASSVFTVQGKDTVTFDFFHSTYKVVMYVDSIGCLSCKLQLPKWKAFIQKVNSLQKQDLDISFVFYFHSKDYKELEYIMSREGFIHPVCFDQQDEFNKLNHFPLDVNCHTFLLNRENKVIAIGNPIYNPKVNDLYLELLINEAISSEKQILTTAELNLDYIDFGIFPKIEKQEQIVEIKNVGTTPLIIQDVSTSCGCTKVEFARKPILVDHIGSLKIVYEASESGHFRKTVDVFCNIASSPLRIVVTGEAK